MGEEVPETLTDLRTDDVRGWLLTIIMASY